MRALAGGAVVFGFALVACGRGAVQPRAEGCPVKTYVAAPDIPVDELGDVSVDCTGTAKCARQLMDEVCAKGGDVLWGLGENQPTSTAMRGHAAHASRTNWGPRPEGCEVRVFEHAPEVKTENIGVVRATCGLDVSDADCLRTLKDKTCELGGDVVWGVGAPEVHDARKTLTGRAAHTK